MADTVNTRELVLDILLQVTKQSAYSHIASANVLEKYQYLDKKDRAFITRITEGTLENLIRIDYSIDQFSKVPVRKMKPVIRCIIRSAAYQICDMDAVPDAAACNEAVRLAKKKGFRNLSGFVNGVLRSLSRNKENISWPDPAKNPQTYLSVFYSMPEWIIQMWQQQFGLSWNKKEDFQFMERLLSAFLQPAPVTVCTNLSRCTPQELQKKLKEEGVETVLVPQVPEAFHITGYDHMKALSCFEEGLFYVQDISSILAAKAAQPKDDDFVVDVCAAPGGKAIHIAQMMHGNGHVLARDLTPYKIDKLLENIRRCKIKNIKAQVWDATTPDDALTEKADIVVADLPCSGLGVLRRKKEIRYDMTPDQIKELASLQREILSVVCKYVKPGGKMIYSTCTISRQENEENIAWFLKEHEQFELLSSRQILPEAMGGDGFYIAQLQKGTRGISKNKQA